VEFSKRQCGLAQPAFTLSGFNQHRNSVMREKTFKPENSSKDPCDPKNFFAIDVW
jgi:hypothetical protein